VGGMAAQLAIIALLLVVMIWFDLYCLRDIAHARYVRYLTPQAWGLLVIITFPIGGILYLTYGRAR
jgi:hypothetical protein